MKKFLKENILYLVFLIFIYILLIYFNVDKYYIYGSTKDWVNQHIVFMDYFRKDFFDTGKFLPSFVMSLGAGQNIFNFAYYGLLSPILFISYLFPGVSTEYFIIFISILLVLFTIILFYIWLWNNKYSSSICFIVTLLFMCASPLIFHTHRHIMFISYYPFLISSFIVIDNYFNNKTKYLLGIFVFLIIMSSYFFSVSALVVLAIYASYKFLKYEKFNIRKYLIMVKQLIIPVILGILSSCILLLPLLSVLKNGRVDLNSAVSLVSLLPQASISFISYSPISLGLTSSFLIALVYNLISNDRSKRFLSIIMLIMLFCPVVIYLLNGGLYINPKVLIPFIPLCCIIYAEFFKDFSASKDIDLKKFIIVFLLLVGFIICTEKYEEESSFYIIFYSELVAMFVLFLISIFTKKKMVFVFPLLVFVFVVSFVINKSESYIDKFSYEKINNKDKVSLVKSVINKDKDFYRFSDTNDSHNNVNRIYDKYYFTTSIYSSTFNADYNNFFFKEFNIENPYRNNVLLYSSKNILFDTLMGIKYKISTFRDSKLYKKVKEKDDYKIYKNSDVYSIGYATWNNMNISDYKKLEYPYNLDALLNASINDKKSNFSFNSNIKKLNWGLDDLNIKNKNGVVRFKNNEVREERFYLPNELKDKVLIISFRMKKEESCNNGDTWIKINGVKNKLTCKEWKYKNGNYDFNYVISSKSVIKSLKLTMSKGQFVIDDVKFYTMDFDYIKNLNKNIDKMNVKRENINDNGFKGSINVKKNSNFVLSIPYDKGFVIKVDGKRVKYRKVNSAFIGFDIEKGKHEIDVKYEPSLAKVGEIISLISIGIMFILVVLERRNKKE